MSPDKTRLIELLRELSFERRPVVLSSGRKSDFYVDGKQTTLHAEGAAVIGRMILSLLREASEPVHGVGGLTLGADPIATAASLQSALDGGPLIHAFLVRKEAKGHGTERYIEGMRNLPAGSRVAIVEDTSTTGASAWKAVERARAAGFEVSHLITVVDRQEGAAEYAAERGLTLLSLVTRDDLMGHAEQAG